MSTGMASEDEIELAVKTVREVTDTELLLFHCISSYPTVTKDSNLNNLTWLKNKFNVQVGLSDHTTDNIAALTAIGMGAVAIEKHFKLDNEVCGPDSSFSLNIKQLRQLINECNAAWAAKGYSSGLNRSKSEHQNIIFRRSIYFIKNLKQGNVIKESDIRVIRPGYGILPKYFGEVVGKKLRNNVQRGDRVTFDVLIDND